MAEILIRHAGIHRPAVVYEFLRYTPGPGYNGKGFDPTGDYAFKEWVDPEDISVLSGASAKETTAAKKNLYMGDIINRDNKELMEWFNDKKKEVTWIEPY